MLIVIFLLGDFMADVPRCWYLNPNNLE